MIGPSDIVFDGMPMGLRGGHFSAPNSKGFTLWIPAHVAADVELGDLDLDTDDTAAK